MGLDMYLYRKVYVGAYFEHRNITGKIEVYENGRLLDINFSKISEVIEQAGYWRKANQIHKWFVDNVQDGEDDCKEYEVGRDDMQSLLNVCNEVIENSELVDGKVQNGSHYENGEWIPILEDGRIIKDSTVAHELLPCAKGFFFGGTDYDEWYLEDVQYTKELLESILSKEHDDGYYCYQSSW